MEPMQGRRDLGRPVDQPIVDGAGVHVVEYVRFAG